MERPVGIAPTVSHSRTSEPFPIPVRPVQCLPTAALMTWNGMVWSTADQPLCCEKVAQQEGAIPRRSARNLRFLKTFHSFISTLMMVMENHLRPNPGI
jgi:hypothetical protein